MTWYDPHAVILLYPQNYIKLSCSFLYHRVSFSDSLLQQVRPQLGHQCKWPATVRVLYYTTCSPGAVTNQRIFQDEIVTRQWHHQLPRSKLVASWEWPLQKSSIVHQISMHYVMPFSEQTLSMDHARPCTYNWCVATRQQASWALASPAATASLNHALHASDACAKNSTAGLEPIWIL